MKNTTVFTMESYTEAVNKRNNFTEVERSILLNEKYALAFIQGVKEAAEISAENPEEKFAETRAEIKDFKRSDFDNELTRDLLEIEFKKFGMKVPENIDWSHFLTETVELMISMVSEALDIQ